ncbi:DUF4326 domain-containing protein [Cereibacter sphaeroides]|uniref:DUF4326 domain-containing protein n=1 Tax=Cereibacter sphaeroides TaxID=1063 RepID=UPI001F1EE967|nr:DUF4326 domain-containing protein [Cereibacter sphaeroides]MCE6957878.1 DUF4326 domain-containing protein [Cereibacter sphaeroides]MCE6971847.1 DUF4326 domain-containing protein [Cereibacter sphaeroides]
MSIEPTIITTTADLRRGLRLGWDWGDNDIGQTMRRQGIMPVGRLITVADLPTLNGCDLGLQVDGHPYLVLDPWLAITKGKTFRLLEDAPIPRILNIHRDGKDHPEAVYIGRPSPWKNHLRLGEDGTREEILPKYIAWLHEHPEVVAAVRRELAGKDLLCFCAPAPCHGEILREIALGRPIPEPVLPRQANLLDLL